MKLIVQIPALNEEQTIAEVIRRIPRHIEGVREIAVVVVNDGSTDRTEELARQAGAQIVRHSQPRGVGAAFRSGIERAAELNADVVVTIDADGQFAPEDIPQVIAPIIQGEADFVTASRFIDKALIPVMPGVKKWGNDFMARWISALVKERFYDVSCGFRAYSRNAYQRLVLLGDFTYTHETFLSLAFARLRIKEVPVKVRGVREHGKSKVASNLFRYGSRTAGIILKTYRDYRPLRFFSSIALALFLIGLGFFAFLVSVKLRTGVLSPHKWSGFAAAAFAGAALAMVLVGIVAEMLERIRVAQDEILFRVRRLENEVRQSRHQPPES
jgi:glycosyltransferase involved in cell wall biosynthesis